MTSLKSLSNTVTIPNHLVIKSGLLCSVKDSSVMIVVIPTKTNQA